MREWTARVNWWAVFAIILTLGALGATVGGGIEYVPVLGTAAIIAAIFSLKE